jgi:hypothetical protein
MNCPYCTEDIKDEAIVCRHCHRDLVFRPVTERLSSLERQIVELVPDGKRAAAPLCEEGAVQITLLQPCFRCGAKPAEPAPRRRR